MTDENVHIFVPGNEEGEVSAARPHQRRKGRASLLVGSVMLALVIIVSIVGSYMWRDVLTVKRVLVGGNRSIPAADIVQVARVKFGMSLFDVNLDVIRKNILSQHYIKSVDVVRELPDKLCITVQERQPIAAIVGERVMFLDEEGMVLPPYEGAMFDVPFIRGVESVNVAGVRITDSRLLEVLELLRRARSLDGGEVYHLISEVHIVPNGELVLYSSDAGVKILLGNVDPTGKLHVLKAFWDQFVLQRGADRLRLIDLRFEDQVIARWDR